MKKNTFFDKIYLSIFLILILILTYKFFLEELYIRKLYNLDKLTFTNTNDYLLMKKGEGLKNISSIILFSTAFILGILTVIGLFSNERKPIYKIMILPILIFIVLIIFFNITNSFNGLFH